MMKIHRIPAWAADTNAYVVAGPSGEAVLVDAPPDADLIGGEVARLGYAVVAILLTHGHVDHTGGSGQLARQTGAITYVHPDDDFLTLNPVEQVKRMFGMVPPGTYEVPPSLESLSHGQILDLAGMSLEVRHTPGHTPGHCCFYSKEDGVVFTGDQLFAGSVGRTDLPGGSWDQLVASMAEQVMTLEDEVDVLPGHGPETTIGRERAQNPFRDEWA